MTRIAAIAIVGAATAASAAVPDPGVDLRALGQEIAAEIEQRTPAPAVAQGDLAALGPCKRPSAIERTMLTARVAMDVARDKLGDLGFGCVDAGGTIVELTFDRGDKAGNRTGVWRVVRVTPTTVTTLAQYEGASVEDYMEWVNEESIHVLGLVDLDGDGIHDALIEDVAHEGGAVHFDATLSLWTSRDGKVARLGGARDGFGIARGQLAPPIVVTGGDGTHRCVDARAGFHLCPAIDAARRIDRALEIAGWFVAGREYGPYKDRVPDRELLAGLLDELGVAPVRRAQLLDEVPDTRPEVRVAREIERFLAPHPVRRYGEVLDVQPPDPEPARLLAAGGDAPCPAMTPADAARVRAAIATWLAAHDRRAILDHGDCKPGVKCAWVQPGPVELASSCGDLAAGYASARWSYLDHDQRLLREVVFAVGAGGLTPIVSTSSQAWLAAPPACGCSGPDSVLDAAFYRHGGKQLAVMFDRSAAETMVFAVDGVRAAGIPVVSGSRGAGETAAQLPASILEIGEAGRLVYWHWDGAWQRLAEIPYGPAAPAPASSKGLERMLWQDVHRLFARWELASFDAARWRDDAAARARARELLVLAGADPALLARVDAQMPSP